MCSFRTLLLLSALSIMSSPALANGRFPKSVSVHLQPGNGQSILLATTFGLLVSRDAGGSWAWICEEAVGYGGSYDPDYAVAADGAIFATTFTGLRVSRDGGCTWNAAGGLSEQEYFVEVELAADGSVWAATASAGMPNHVYVSTDNGRSFSPRDTGLPDIWWRSLRVAPSDVQRAYLSGYRVADAQADAGASPPQAAVFRTDDGGGSWSEVDVSSLEMGAEPWLMVEAVEPRNPDIVYLRSQAAHQSQGDIVYRADIGTGSFAEVLRTRDQVRAFAIRKSGELVVGALIDGVHRSSDRGANWEHSGSPEMCCVAETEQGQLYACGANWAPDNFALGISDDGVSWQKVMTFAEVGSAHACPSGTLQSDLCAVARWPGICKSFACSEATEPPVSHPPVGVEDSSGCSLGRASRVGGAPALLLACLLVGVALAARRRGYAKSVFSVPNQRPRRVRRWRGRRGAA